MVICGAALLATMRTWTKTLIVIPFGLVAVVALPPVAIELAKQPSCAAFVGMRPAKPLSEESRRLFERHRDKALSSSAFQQPSAPSITVVRVAAVYDGQITDAFFASRSAVGWKVDEVVLDESDPRTTTVAKKSRILESSQTETLDRLISKRCLFRERTVAGFPHPWLSLPYLNYYDGETRSIEVSDGGNTRLFHQATDAYGISGALGAIVVKGGLGIPYPPGGREDDAI